MENVPIRDLKHVLVALQQVSTTGPSCKERGICLNVSRVMERLGYSRENKGIILEMLFSEWPEFNDDDNTTYEMMLAKYREAIVLAENAEKNA